MVEPHLYDEDDKLIGPFSQLSDSDLNLIVNGECGVEEGNNVPDEEVIGRAIAAAYLRERQ